MKHPLVSSRFGLRLIALFVMCCSILCPISATDETLAEHHKVEVQNPKLVFDDDAKTVEKQILLHRQRKSVKKNATRSLAEVEKRLQAMEERYAFVSMSVVLIQNLE